MAIEYYVDPGGNYVGEFDGIDPPIGSLLVPSRPVDTREIWNFGFPLAFGVRGRTKSRVAGGNSAYGRGSLIYRLR